MRAEHTAAVSIRCESWASFAKLRAVRAKTSVGSEVSELQITLLEIEPPVWRRVAVPSDLTLADLHLVLQAVMGWENQHLHQFETPEGDRYETHDLERDPDGPARGAYDASDVGLDEVLPRVGSTLRYMYDFGDGWEHRIELVAMRPRQVGERLLRCLGGERACPPEDCGGADGYAELRDALADPKHEQHEEFTAWLAAYRSGPFDAETFDLAEANGALRGLSL